MQWASLWTAFRSISKAKNKKETIRIRNGTKYWWGVKTQRFTLENSYSIDVPMLHSVCYITSLDDCQRGHKRRKVSYGRCKAKIGRSNQGENLLCSMTMVALKSLCISSCWVPLNALSQRFFLKPLSSLSKMSVARTTFTATEPIAPQC